nr:MAG TPA: Rad50 ABC-ATPase, Mre11, DNA double-strand break [Caudoviricetes sp.]
MKVQVKDYQAVKKATINIQGLTILRGASNAGKSSFVRAFLAAANNRFKSGVVRHGEDFAEIKIQTEPDQPILTVRRKATGASPIMKLGDRVFNKLNRELPIEVTNYLNFGSINVSNSEKYNLNFFTQFQPPLLFGFSQKKVMDVLSASKAVDQLNALRKELDISRTELRGKISATDANLSKIKEDLSVVRNQLQSFPDLTEVQSKSDELIKLNLLWDKLQSLSGLIDFYVDVSNRVASLEILISKIQSLEDLRSNYLNLSKLSNSLKESDLISSKIYSLEQLASISLSYDNLIKEKESISNSLDKVELLSEMVDQESFVAKKLLFYNGLIDLSKKYQSLIYQLSECNSSKLKLTNLSFI